MNLRFTLQAKADLQSSLEHIRERAPSAADDLADLVIEVAKQLANGDFEGPEQVLTSGMRVRSWPVPPFRLYYQRRGDTLWVLRVYHHARRPITK